MTRPVLAVDPGTQKCGVAVASTSAEALHLAIVDTPALGTRAAGLIEEHHIQVVLVGDRTGSGPVADALAQACPRAEIVFVDEHMSTLRARERYFRDNPPRGIARLLPRGLRVPPEPYDHYVALVLAEDYLRARAEVGTA